MSAPSSYPTSSSSTPTGALFIVATPIGNLGDITLRAVEVLKSVALVVAEDTRHSRTLLTHLEVATPMTAYHEHNEARESPRLVKRMLAGESIALISDAGTPLLSDPGARLVAAAIEAEIAVIPIPGASALLAALVASGISAEQFTFLGFLPRKGMERDAAIRAIARSPFTTIVYESPQRVSGTLADMIEAGCGERAAALARELTKKFEEVRRGSITSLHEAVAAGVRGEVVLVIAGSAERAPTESEARETVSRMRSEGASARDIIERLTTELGVARNVAYKLAHSPPDSTPAG
ncbi:MAG: 16S rRNA (cytidine(1402)-2'-O)-methyltransferase [Gemmatimonadaceae bacterium]